MQSSAYRAKFTIRLFTSKGIYTSGTFMSYGSGMGRFFALFALAAAFPRRAAFFFRQPSATFISRCRCMLRALSLSRAFIDFHADVYELSFSVYARLSFPLQLSEYPVLSDSFAAPERFENTVCIFRTASREFYNRDPPLMHITCA